MPSDRASAVRRRLNDILHNIGLAENFLAGLDYDAFHRDRLRVYGVIRCLEIISEASRHLPHDLKARHSAIEWKEMSAAGNIYRHEYEDVAERRVWSTVRLALPPLRAAVEDELKGTRRSMNMEARWIGLSLDFPTRVRSEVFVSVPRGSTNEDLRGRVLRRLISKGAVVTGVTEGSVHFRVQGAILNINPLSQCRSGWFSVRPWTS
jgi:uncharacterized protein with HEPN domain